MFSSNGPMAHRVYPWAAIEHDDHITAEILTKFCSTIKTGSTHCERRTGAKSAIYDFLVFSLRSAQVGQAAKKTKFNHNVKVL